MYKEKKSEKNANRNNSDMKAFKRLTFNTHIHTYIICIILLIVLY